MPRAAGKSAPSAPSAPYHHGHLRRSLVEAALAIVKERPDWNFSLREVARRAGVSHNAPYFHFAEKRDLLAAVAEVGFKELQERMTSAIVGLRSPQEALVKTGCVYVKFGIENPAHYRLMFGSVLSGPDGRPASVAAAGAATRAMLENIIHDGARSGDFAVSHRQKANAQIAVLTAWSAVHGLTMLAIDGIREVSASDINRVATGVARKISRALQP